MYLLSTDSAHLRHFNSPEDEELNHDGGYAILSHVWDEKEQSFQDIQELMRKCASSTRMSRWVKRRLLKGHRALQRRFRGVSEEDVQVPKVLAQTPRDLACEKIKKCCELAERHGFKWLWIDTCCIDKSSSAELSEAINSMYRYYSLARLCYAYLRDVQWLDTHYSLPRFYESKWHTRGWTLQELIAPEIVVFLSQSWSIIGTKADLAGDLELITKVPATVLTLEASPAEKSVAQRMSWAASRHTTRSEDEAYCLLGIFGINMPTLYGEGRQAFRRLQEEIMKKSPDTTVFAWQTETCDGFTTRLFATSPREFRHSGDITYISSSRSSQIKERKTMSFSVTPHGIRAWIPVMEWNVSRGVLLADLSWFDEASRHFVFLPLCQSTKATTTSYEVFIPGSYEGRLVRSPISLRREGTGTFTFQKILISESPVSSIIRNPPIPMTLTWRAPIRISPHLSQDICSVRNAGPTWTGDPPLVLTMKHVSLPLGELYVIQIGRCVADDQPIGRDGGLLWIRVKSGMQLDDHRHSCSQDHIESWDELRNTFVLYAKGPLWENIYRASLVLTRCPWNPSTLLLQTVNVEKWRHTTADDSTLPSTGRRLQHPENKPSCSAGLARGRAHSLPTSLPATKIHISQIRRRTVSLGSFPRFDQGPFYYDVDISRLRIYRSINKHLAAIYYDPARRAFWSQLPPTATAA